MIALNSNPFKFSDKSSRIKDLCGRWLVCLTGGRAEVAIAVTTNQGTFSLQNRFPKPEPGPRVARRPARSSWRRHEFVHLELMSCFNNGHPVSPRELSCRRYQSLHSCLWENWQASSTIWCCSIFYKQNKQPTIMVDSWHGSGVGSTYKG